MGLAKKKKKKDEAKKEKGSITRGKNERVLDLFWGRQEKGKNGSPVIGQFG